KKGKFMNTIQKFIETIIEPDFEKEVMELRLISPDNKVLTKFVKDLNQLEQIVSKNQFNYNIYFGTATRKNNQSGKKDNCNKIKSLWVDIDCGSEGHKKKNIFATKELAIEYINKCKLQPSIIVD